MSQRCRIILSIVGVLIVVTHSAKAETSKRIPLSRLEEMFANMRAKTNWNVDGPLLWGYFFFDPEKAKLNKAATELTKRGFRLVALEKVEGEQLYRLHVERAETHTPDSLNARNEEFYALAERLELRSYDGMDVGPLPQRSK